MRTLRLIFLWMGPEPVPCHLAPGRLLEAEGYMAQEKRPPRLVGPKVNIK